MTDLEYLRIYRELRSQGLTEPPPFADPEKTAGWKAGYEDAIKDIVQRFEPLRRRGAHV